MYECHVARFRSVQDYSSEHNGEGLYLLKEYRTFHQRSVYSRDELPFCFYFENTIRVTVRELLSHINSDPVHIMLPLSCMVELFHASQSTTQTPIVPKVK